MDTYEENSIALEALGIPRTTIHWYHGRDLSGSAALDVPSDIRLALREMKRGETITLEQFKKEFKKWRQCIIRMAGFNMVFTKHFESQLNTVLTYYEEQHGYMEFSSALFECLCWKLRKLPKSPIKNSQPTTRPDVRFFMTMDINVTFHYTPDLITVLSICTDGDVEYA